MQEHAMTQTLPNGYPADAFTRLDESDDAIFYATDRFVSHLDAKALDTVSAIIENLVVEKRPAILDLMAGPDSHLPTTLQPSTVVGLGLNVNELTRNPALDERTFHDLNRDPTLPYDTARFDVVLNTVSVDYLVQPVSVFEEVARVLKPGGLFLVVFSNRMFPKKAVNIWKSSGEQERVMLVQDYFRNAGGFTAPELFVSKGQQRPRDDKYAHLDIPSDPIYAVYAEKEGAAADRPKRRIAIEAATLPSQAVIAERKARGKQTLRCPYCDQRMKKWRVPQTPFTEWPEPFFYICFNDACPFLLRGWHTMQQQGNIGFSYRTQYIRERDHFSAIPVRSLGDLRSEIVEET